MALDGFNYAEMPLGNCSVTHTHGTIYDGVLAILCKICEELISAKNFLGRCKRVCI